MKICGRHTFNSPKPRPPSAFTKAIGTAGLYRRRSSHRSGDVSLSTEAIRTKPPWGIRPIWHQKQDRVLAHILVCFPAYVLWKTLAALCEKAGRSHEPRRVLDELSHIRRIDVVLPTKGGIELRKRCITKPTEHQAILWHHLGMVLRASAHPGGAW